MTESVRKARIVTVSVEWPLLGETRLLGWTEHPAVPLADTADNVRPGAQASCPALPYIYLCRHCHPTGNLDLAILHISHRSIAHSERILTIPNSFLSILNFDSSIGWASFICPFLRFGKYQVFKLSSVLDDPLNKSTTPPNMSSLTRVLLSAAFASLAYGHSQILNAQGEAGSPASVGFLGMKITIKGYRTRKDFLTFIQSRATLQGTAHPSALASRTPPSSVMPRSPRTSPTSVDVLSLAETSTLGRTPRTLSLPMLSPRSHPVER